MAAFRIRLLPGDRALLLHLSRGNWYELEDGSRLPVATRPAWCSHCEAFVEAEFLPPTDPPADPPISSRRQEWLERRSSPPHCLECGSLDVTLLPILEETPSPCHDGTLTVEPGVITPPLLHNRVYTPEGARKA